MATRAEWPAKNETALLRFLRALAEAQAWLNDARNRSDAIAILTEAAKLRSEDSARSYQLLVESAQAVPKSPDLDMNGLKTAIDLMGEAEVLRTPLPAPEKFADTSFTTRARQ